MDPSDAKGLLEVIDIDGNGKARVACRVFFWGREWNHKVVLGGKMEHFF